MNIDFAAFEHIARNSSAEEGVSARFYDRSIKTDKIDEQGFPVFQNVCFCEIRIKDNNSEVFDQPATEEKKKRFPQEYARYLLSKKQIAEGTPLEQFAFLSLSEVEALKCRGIFTIETLAELDTDKASGLGVLRERNLAQKFKQQAANTKQLSDWQAEEEQYIQKIIELEDEVKSLRLALSKKGEK